MYYRTSHDCAFDPLELIALTIITSANLDYASMTTLSMQHESPLTIQSSPMSISSITFSLCNAGISSCFSLMPCLLKQT